MNPTIWGIKIKKIKGTANKPISITFETFITPAKKEPGVMFATNHALQNYLTDSKIKQIRDAVNYYSITKEIWAGKMTYTIHKSSKVISCEVGPFVNIAAKLQKELMHIGIGSLIERQCTHYIKKKHPALANYNFYSITNSTLRKNQLKKTKRFPIKSPPASYVTINKLKDVDAWLSEYVAKGMKEHEANNRSTELKNWLAKRDARLRAMQKRNLIRRRGK